MTSSSPQKFAKGLMAWDIRSNHRKMPWKGINDPYKIWLSEIILQQTRVDQGEKYYHAFIQAYPTITALAKAPEEEVLLRWQGLGYYNRCRNMMATAALISQQYHGVFPNEYEKIFQLKGIGEYTAAAIASFAFNLPYAVVDGNVVRVLSRVFGLAYNFFETKGKREFQIFAQEQLDLKQPGKYNQALMDFGATICKPQQPICTECPFNKECVALKENKIANYPIKKIKNALKERSFHFLVMHTKTHLYLVRRVENDIWKGLHTFFHIETQQLLHDDLPHFVDNVSLKSPIVCQQLLTHQKITGFFYEVQLQKPIGKPPEGIFKVKKSELNKYAFPKLILSFFEKIDYL